MVYIHTYTHTHTHTIECYLAIKKSKILPFVVTYMGIMIREINQRKTNTV